MSPGNGGRNPLSRALCSVERAGEYRAPWAKATRSAVVALLLIAGSACPAVGGISVVHNPFVPWLRVPCMMVSFLCLIWHVSASKCPVQPASHSWPNEIREVSPRAGNMCALVASSGRLGNGRLATPVEYMYS